MMLRGTVGRLLSAINWCYFERMRMESSELTALLFFRYNSFFGTK